MEIDEAGALDIIKRHMENQGCVGDSLDSLAFMQPHLYEWICFFGFEEEIADKTGTEEGEMKKEILHKKGCYCMYFADNGRCLRCGVLFKDKKKITAKTGESK